jgi:hypothetical protein
MLPVQMGRETGASLALVPKQGLREIALEAIFEKVGSVLCTANSLRILARLAALGETTALKSGLFVRSMSLSGTAHHTPGTSL